MDSRLSVLFDLLTELEAEDRQGLAEALAARPELWLQVPRGARVALPWGAQSGPLHRYAAGSDALIAEIGSHRAEASGQWRAQALGEILRYSTPTGRRIRVFTDLSEAKAVVDAALLAAGWVLL